MFSLNYRLIFSILAQGDVDDILAYTLETWGMRQLAEYKRLLDKAFERISENPYSAPLYSPSGLRSLRAGSHMVFYRVDEDNVTVARILHERMEPDLHLEE